MPTPEDKESDSPNEANAPPSIPAPSSLPRRSPRDPSSLLDRLLVVEGSALATSGRVFFQVRRGPLTQEALDRACAAAIRHRTMTPRGTLQGLIFLTEPGAAIPTEAVRARQRGFIADALKRPDIRMATVIPGKDLGASLLRSVSRAAVAAHPQLRVFEQPKAACDWLSGELSMKVEHLVAALTEVRTVAARELSGAP